MLQIDNLKNELKGLVGWEKPYGWQGEWGRDGESGVLVNDVHPLVTIDNIRSTMPENFFMTFDEYVEAEAYESGNIVRYDGKVWLCVQDAPSGEKPSYSSTYWKMYDYIREYLDVVTEKGIQQMVQKFSADKSIAGESKNILEKRAMFDGAGRLTATLANNHRIAGMEIVPVRSLGVTTKIERVGLQMRGGTGIVTMYVFHSSEVDPIYTFECNYTNQKGGFQWFYPEDLYIPYLGSNHDDGGSWYLVYNQDDLPQGMEAINVSKDWSREPCGTCNIGNIEAWREITKYLQISPFTVEAPTTFAQFPEMWDVQDMHYTNTQNYGINFEISVGCDLSHFIYTQRLDFANVLAKQIAYNVLRTMAMNPDVRVNRNQSNVNRMDILYELDGNPQGRKTGLGVELEKAYQAIEIDTKGIDRICLTCNNHGVRYRTV